MKPSDDAIAELMAMVSSGSLNVNEARKRMNYNEYIISNIPTTGTQWPPGTQPYQYTQDQIITWRQPTVEVVAAPPLSPADEDPITWLHRRVDELVDSALVAA